MSKMIIAENILKIIQALYTLLLFNLQVEMEANKMKLSFASQLFIDNEFVDASNGKRYDTINPADESVRKCLHALKFKGTNNVTCKEN